MWRGVKLVVGVGGNCILAPTPFLAPHTHQNSFRCWPLPTERCLHISTNWPPPPLASSSPARPQVLAAAHQALSTSGLSGDIKAEKQLVALLTIPLTKYDVVTGLGLSKWTTYCDGSGL